MPQIHNLQIFMKNRLSHKVHSLDITHESSVSQVFKMALRSYTSRFCYAFLVRCGFRCFWIFLLQSLNSLHAKFFLCLSTWENSVDPSEFTSSALHSMLSFLSSPLPLTVQWLGALTECSLGL